MPQLIESIDIIEAQAIKLSSSSCMQLSRLSTDPDLQSPRASSNAYSPQARKLIVNALDEGWIQSSFPILQSVACFHDDDLYCLWRSCEGLLDVLTFSLRRISARKESFPSIEALGAAIVASRVVSRRLPSLSLAPTRSPSCLSPNGSGSAHHAARGESSSEHVSPCHRSNVSIDALPTRLPAVRAGSISINTPKLYDTNTTPTMLSPVGTIALPASPILTRKRASTSPHHYIEERSPSSSRPSVSSSPTHQRDLPPQREPTKRDFHRSLVSIPSMGDEEKQLPNEPPTPEDRIVAFLLSADGATLLRGDQLSNMTISVQSLQPYFIKHHHLTTGALFLALRMMSRSHAFSSFETLFDVVYRHANRTFILDMLRCSSIFESCGKRIELNKSELDTLAALNITHLKHTVALMDAGNVKLGNTHPINELIDIVTRSSS